MLYRVTGTQSVNIGDGHLVVIRLVHTNKVDIHYGTQITKIDFTRTRLKDFVCFIYFS